MNIALRRQRVGAHKQLKYNPHVNDGEYNTLDIVLTYSSEMKYTEYRCGEFLIYEEVTKIAPQKNRPRPIVLVGKY